MQFSCSALVVSLIFCCFFLEITASSISEEFASLPRIFYLNDTEQCPEEHYYCKINIKLKPRDLENPPKLWKLIEKETMYKRDFVYRAFCIGGDSIGEKVQEELLEYNLTGDIVHTHCSHQLNFNQIWGKVEIILTLFISTYLSFMIYCTTKTYSSKSSANKYVKIFSFINIWKEIMDEKRNEDYTNLLSIQGMRTFAMFFVIGFHTIIIRLLMVFVRNPEYFEDVHSNLARSLFFNSFGLVVQIFFIISAWLLAVQLHNVVRDNGKFTWKNLLLLWINRYLRFMPAVLLILLCFNSDAVIATSHPYYYSITTVEVETCKLTWWKNLLFIQNMYGKEERMCAVGMWYIAADFQMYILVSTFFYISRKWNISMKYFLGLMAGVSVFIQMFNVLTSDYGGLIRFTPRLLPAEEAVVQPEFAISYFQTYGSCVTYIIGFIFGTHYWYNKKNNIFNTTMKKLAFYAAFLGLPLLTCYVYGIRSNRVVEALLSASLRPLFSLGIAVGLIGMATGTGGYIKKLFESSPVVFFGNFTYSIYMFHFFCVFGRAFFKAQYIEVGDFHCIANWIIDITISFTFGMLMYITLEHPFIRLQKQLVPQINKTIKRKIENKVE